ncbi:hypothetical protein LguiA_029523 [Lonicera macranthoides]
MKGISQFSLTDIVNPHSSDIGFQMEFRRRSPCKLRDRRHLKAHWITSLGV